MSFYTTCVVRKCERADADCRLMSDAEIPLTLEECKTIFDLTRMWGFDKVRRVAKDRIRTHHWAFMASVAKINLALEFELEDWYLDAYNEIVSRKEPLTTEEMQKLGFDLSAKITKARETAVRAAPCSGMSFGSGAPSLNTIALNNTFISVCRFFGICSGRSADLLQEEPVVRNVSGPIRG